MTTPMDINHPVSGNREFGIYNDAARPGEFTFYTMGVDRTSDILFDIANYRNNVYKKGDELWSNIQKNMIQFIINNGGQAETYTPKRVVARPRYMDVERYLKGQIDFPTLKTLLGC